MNNTMDYKKAYEDAINRLENCYKDSFGCVHIKPEEIFPELKKENKDEELRKCTIALLKIGREKGFYDFPRAVNKCIDWLERQKEDYSGFDETQRKYMEKYIGLDKVTLVKLLAERDENVEATLKNFANEDEEPKLNEKIKI